MKKYKIDKIFLLKKIDITNNKNKLKFKKTNSTPAGLEPARVSP